jgi:Viral BACON domain
VTVSVNPTGLSAGTYNGTVTITATGATGSPQSVKVTLAVTPAGTSSLTVNPSALNFNVPTVGGGDDAGEAFGAQRLAISSTTGAAVSYTAKEATQSGGNWLMLGSSGGTTPGTQMVSVNPRGLASGIYHGTITITPSGAAAGPQMVPVTLTVGSPTTSSLHATPRHLTFSFSGTNDSGSKTVRVTTAGTAREFSAAAFGGSWLNVSPTSATTPATLTVSVDAHGLSMGTYSGMITLTTGTRKTFVYVTVFVATSGSGGGGGDDGSEAESQLAIQPVVTDPTNSGTVGATLLDAAGVPVSSQSSSNSGNLALALSKTAHAPAGTSAGAQLVPAESLTKLTELGFDVRQGGHCTATSPHFVVVTSDEVTHILTGCAHGSIQTAPAPGWIRMRFDPTNPAQANIPIAPGQQIKSIAIVLDEGPESTPNLAGGLVVLDNIDVNGVIIGKD